MDVGIKVQKDMVSMDSGAKYEPKDKDVFVLIWGQNRLFFLHKEFDQQSCVKNTATFK